nr:PREDICTED: uncharacterized protein LOC108217506 [Daucus carota subsp. sativus]
MQHQKINMEGLWSDDEVPVSPTGQYFNSSVLSISVLSVLESEIPIDDSLALTLLKDLFLPINPRFSSIMVEDNNGVKQWKKVFVELQDHVNVPTFPEGKFPEFYDACLNDYLGKTEPKSYLEILQTVGIDKPEELLLVTSDMEAAMTARAVGKNH